MHQKCGLSLRMKICFVDETESNAGKISARLDPKERRNLVAFDVEKAGDVAVVLFPEETLEASNANDFRGKMEDILEENTRLVFDMSHVRFIDSMGCGLLVSFLKMLQEKGGGLKLCCITAPVKNLFMLMGFDKLFGIFKTREEAVKAFR
jgi:anti-sigma B factor antagonist